MSASVLVATPHLAFGELLRLSLEEDERFRVRLVRTAREAAAISSQPACKVAILDAELPDMSIAELSSQLLARLPQLKIILIPPDNDLDHPTLSGMVYHGHILRPFYLPDLMALMEKLTGDGAPGGTAPQPDKPDAEAFERAMAASSAMAGVLLYGQDESLVSGAVPPAVADELKTMVQRARITEAGELTDLVRFVRLPGQTGDHLFYITPMEGKRALGLAYTVGAPLSRIRVQAAQVIRALAPIQHPPKIDDRVSHPVSAPATSEDVHANPPPLPEEELVDDEGEFQEIDLAALLGSIPSPDPGQPTLKPDPTDWVPEISMSLPQSESETTFPWDEVEAASPAAVTAVPAEPEPVHDLEATRPVLTSPAKEEKLPAQTPPDLAQTMPIQPAVPDRPFLKLDEPAVDELEDTKPRVLTNLTHLGQLDPVSPAFSQLSYTCVLIPRLPQHHLTGVLSEKLSQWVQQFCLAFGWRLEGIAVRPEYLQWTVQVSPSIAPGNLMRIIRQRVSDSIFENFPTLAQQNPSGDFWATGYLIVGGPQPPSPRLLRDYIAETRRRQGSAYPSGDPLALPVENQARLPKG